MSRSHLTVALRSISRQKAYSCINIAGLATGMACFLLIFVYRISPGTGTFVFSGLLALFVALIAVSAQSIKAALANPVDSLRQE